MAACRLLSRDVKCHLCGGVTGRLVRLASQPTARPQLALSPSLPNGLRYAGKRLVCAFCGGSLYLDSAEEVLIETQRVYPRERRGRPPGSGRRRAETGT